MKLVLFLLIIYFLFGLILFFNQKSLIYYPDNQDFERCSGFVDYQTLNYKGTRFYFKKGSDEKVVIYYHGNAGSACDRSAFKSTFEDSGSSLIFVEYTGYSHDKVNPSQKHILKDVQNINDYVQERGYKTVVVYGQSLGSGPASYHAYLGHVQHLILVTPFSSLAEVAQSKYVIYPISLLLTEHYNNSEWLQNYKGSLLILHGDQDTLIPHRFSKRLFNQSTTQHKEYILLKGIGHNDIWESFEFKQKLGGYLMGV